jgi:P-type Cu2+ transporter
MITGESNPVRAARATGSSPATVVADASLRVEVDRHRRRHRLAGIQRMVADAQESRSRTQVLADRAAALLFYVAVAAGRSPRWCGRCWASRLRRRPHVTVLVIACPHALGLAIPLVTAISTSKSARSGILVKDRLALEQMRRSTRCCSTRPAR